MNNAFNWIQIHKKIVVLVLLAVILLLGFGVYSSSRKSSAPQSVAEQQDAHPINGWLPVQTPQYKITYFYSQSARQYYYQITLFAIINRPSQYNSYIAQLRQEKKAALAYISSKGGNPAKLHIQYLPPAAAKL